MKPTSSPALRPRGKPSYIDGQFWRSFLYTAVFYGLLMAVLIRGSWAAGRWAAVTFFLFVLWAYRRSIGARLGLCARRSGAHDS